MDLARRAGKTFTALTYDVPEGGAFRLTCTDDMTSADVAGCFMPAKDGFAQRIDKAHEAGLAKLPSDLRPLAESMVGSGTGRNVSLRTFYAFDTLRARMSTEHAA